MVNPLTTCKVLGPRKPGEKRELPQFSKGNYQINWMALIFVIYSPIVIILYCLYGHPFPLMQMMPAILLWFTLTGLVGNTGGYHRLFSHKSYKCKPWLRYLIAFLGAGNFQGSIRWWAKLHRIHHKNVDTDKDPYDARRGFFFSHCGWFLMRIDYDLLGDVDMSDLDSDPVVIWQRKYWGWLCALSGFVLPWLHCWYITGNQYAAHSGAHFKIFLLHHATFFINSLNHTDYLWAGAPYNDENTPRDNLISSILTFGEGYHNYHHEFPDDYRNGVRWYQWDPTKWFIYACSRLGWTYDLKRAPQVVIQRAKHRAHLAKLIRETSAEEQVLREADPPVREVMTEDDVQRLVQEEGRRLLIVDKYVLDLDKPIQLERSLTHDAATVHWYDAHPGGRKFLDAYMGKDATEAMRGGVYKHTRGAECLVPQLRIAHLKRKVG